MTENQPLFVAPGHFYSPIPSRDEAEFALFRYNQNRTKPVLGIDLSADRMVAIWSQMQPAMCSAPFPVEKGGAWRYHFDNPFFSYGDALTYYALLERFRPNRVVEVGSGFSSALLLDSVDHLGLETLVTLIEPYPSQLHALLRREDAQRVKVTVSKVQGVELSVFEELEAGDFLFIDSSHVAKAGSDVTVEVLDILPILQPGVLVHFHDIFSGFEYPEAWLIEQNRGWNEAYILKAFLMFNNNYKILFFNDFFAAAQREEVLKSSSPFKLNPGGSLWLERVATL